MGTNSNQTVERNTESDGDFRVNYKSREDNGSVPGIFINVFSRRVPGFHRQAKPYFK